MEGEGLLTRGPHDQVPRAVNPTTEANAWVVRVCSAEVTEWL